MLVQIFRSRFSLTSTQGVMGIDGSSKFVTLEPPRASGMLIPAATYHCIKTLSPRLKYICPEIMNVPGHTGERIHIGNYPKDTEGCVLVGMYKGSGPDVIMQSEDAFEELMGLTDQEFDLQIIDQPKAVEETT